MLPARLQVGERHLPLPSLDLHSLQNSVDLGWSLLHWWFCMEPVKGTGSQIEGRLRYVRVVGSLVNTVAAGKSLRVTIRVAHNW